MPIGTLPLFNSRRSLKSHHYESNERKENNKSRPRQGRVKLPFYPGNGVEVESKGKDVIMG